MHPGVTELRNVPGLREPKRGYFSRRSDAFLHFHEDAGDLYVDVKVDRGSNGCGSRVQATRVGLVIEAGLVAVPTGVGFG